MKRERRTDGSFDKIQPGAQTTFPFAFCKQGSLEFECFSCACDCDCDENNFGNNENHQFFDIGNINITTCKRCDESEDEDNSIPPPATYRIA